MLAQATLYEPPLRIGAAADFARAKSALRASGFNEDAVCRALKIESLSDLGTVRAQTLDFAGINAQLSFFIKIFLALEPVSRTEAETLLDDATLRSFQALDLLRADDFHREKYYSPVLLYPLMGCLIASDRHNNADGSLFVAPPDIVFPAIYAGTLRFLKVISKTAAEDALDMCSGTGIAALLLGPRVKRSVASDITARATHFATFNRLLNGLDNVEIVEGDLYAPLEGRTFDRIVAHPPYVPSLADEMIYRDGGATGDALVRRIIEGLPAHLRKGGDFYTLCLAVDTTEGRFEERARAWLGDARDEFDVVFAFDHELSLKKVLRDIVTRTQSDDPSAITRLEQAFENIGTTGLVYGALFMHRHETTNNKPWTTRLRLAPDTDGADFEWAIRWHRRCEETNFLEKLRHARPRLAPHFSVTSVHAVVDGALVLVDLILEASKPFLTATRIDAWVVPLIAEFDGAQTPVEVYAKARANGAVPESFNVEDFMPLVAMLIERGYLALDD